MSNHRWRSPVLLSLSSLVLLNAGAAFAFSSKPLQNSDPAPAPVVVDPAPVVVNPAPVVVVDPAPVTPPPLVLAPSDIVRIVSVNGTYDPNHAATINVKPGDMITLSADLLDQNNSYQAEGQPVEDFNWSADDVSTDVCSGGAQGDCLTNSNFQFTNYGVDFYVPTDIGKQLTISVSSTLSDAGVDTITLINSSYEAPLPPVVIITAPEQYPTNTFDPEIAVNGQGRWVVIDQVRYWSPYTYQTDASEEWVPYRNGYWNWSDGFGYTWVSYDPWGWATDHYGVWRHHGTYGWMWRPFDDRHYEPHAVSWFDNGGNIGWYPYLNTWQEGYRQHEEVGFDDGFWLGYDVRQHYGENGYGYHPGYSVCGYNDFRNQNIHDVIINRGYGYDPRVIEIVNANRFGRYPGQFNDYNSSRPYVESRCGGEIEVVRTEQIRCQGGAEIFRPEPAHPVPPFYGQVARSFNPQNRTPIGTVYGQGPNGNGGFRPIPPSSNGRGLANPPRITDPRTGGVSEVPPRAQHPLAPGQGNPITGHQPVSQPITRPQPPQAPGPVFHPQPGQPHPGQPHPGQPQPQPVRPEPVQPQPGQPHPGQPQPQPVRPEPVQPQPGQPHPGQPQPQPVRPEPVQPQPVRPQPQPQPVRPQPQPQPRPQPQPQPVRPQPQPQPVRPQPQPQPQPRPQPQPQPRPQPQPQPRPQPQPQPRPQPQPQPVRPQPQPQPVRPQPQPQPQPQPRPQPQPQPRPQPQPQPRPQPQPQPRPQPGGPGHR